MAANDIVITVSGRNDSAPMFAELRTAVTAFRSAMTAALKAASGLDTGLEKLRASMGAATSEIMTAGSATLGVTEDLRLMNTQARESASGVRDAKNALQALGLQAAKTSEAQAGLDHMSAAAEHAASATKDVGAASGAAASKIHEIGSSAEKASGGLSGMAASAASFVGNLASNVVTSFASSVASAAKQVVLFGIESAAGNQTAAVSFEVLLGTAQKAAAFLGQLQKFAAATPFDLPSLKDAASKLLAVGVAAKDVIPLMTRLGDATAGMGTGAQGIERAVYALQQVKTGGVVHAQDMMQLTDAGIPALDALAAHFKVTITKVRDMITAGQVHPEDLFAAIESGEGPAFQRLNGMMDKQSATLSGMWSTLKDNVQQSLASAFAPSIPALSKLVDWAGQEIPKMISGVMSFGRAIAGMWKESGAGDIIKKALGDPKTIEDMKKAIHDLGEDLASHRPMFEQIMRNFAEGLAMAIKYAPMMVNALRDIIDAGIWLARVSDEIELRYLDMFKTILHAAATAFGWIPGIGAQLRDSDKQMQGFIDHIKANLASLSATNTTVTINTRVTGPGTAAILTPGGGFNTSKGGIRALAHGGVVGAAGGGPRSGTTLVGENGPELVDLAPGSTVHSASDTAMMGGAGQRVDVTIGIDPTGAEDAFLSWLLRALRVRGVDTASVFGI